MKRIVIDVDGRTLEGWAERMGSTVWVHVDGRTFCYEPEPAAGQRAGARPGAGAKRTGPGRAAGDIVAPMPGRINKVAVSPGDQVGQHQVVLVMEAMKMEYTLKAQIAGKVLAVKCAPGDQVALGQLLVKVGS